MIDTTQLRQELQDSRSAVERLSARSRETAAAIVECDRERDHAWYSPAPIDELEANISQCVDALTAAYADDIRHTLIREASGRYQENGDGYALRQPQLPRLHQELRLIDLIGLVPDLVKARLVAIARSAPYESAGPLSERPRFAAVIEARKRELEDVAAELHDLGAAQHPPIALPLPESVRQRREQARRDAQRQTLDAQRQQELEDGATRTSAPRRPTGRFDER